MGLSNDLISQFVKATKDSTKTDVETTVYGTIEIKNESKYIILDGDNEKQNPIPLSNNQLAVTVIDGDRVRATIKNHNLVVSGNISNPSTGVENVRNTVIEEFNIIAASKASVEELYAERARIDVLVAEDITIKNRISADEADIVDLQAEDVTIKGELSANTADISKLKTDKLDVNTANAKFATIENLSAAEADIYDLESAYGEFVDLATDTFTAIDGDIKELQTDRLTASEAAITYANIDFSNIGKAAIEHFYATSGLIEDVVVDNGTITGRLVGVTISGDLIEGNTVKAEKLVIKGSDGLYYKLNTDGMKTEAEQTDQNSLNGSIIKAKSITATKINVSDLVAFGATIGGINIAEGALYTGAKTSVDNTTIGVYLDKDGQMAIGDTNSYIKYYTDSNGNRKLDISADSIRFGSNHKNLESAIEDIEIGGRNLLLKSETKAITPYLTTKATQESGVEVTEWTATDAKRIYGTGDDTSVIFGTLGGTANQGASDSSQSYSSTIYVKNNHATKAVIVSANHGNNLFDTVSPGECKRVELVGMGNGWGYLQFNFKTPNAGDEFDITYWHPMIELGNKPTDWTPAPEDMATVDEVEEVSSTANDAQTRVAAAESLIEILSESISMLVTDANGASLMEQTENGWTFSTGDIQELVNRTSENLASLTNEVGDVSGTVDILQRAVSDLGTLADYVKINTYEDEPCIELGESDSEFKLRITNTRMIFTEGSTVLAYFNNQSFHVKKAVVEEELQQGGFVWKIRANGNLGLVWKGVSS